MARSTASFVAYDLRPSKQTERRLLLDFLECAKEGGLNVSNCRYVGMGGFKFYDFMLMHRYVGLREMISLEHDIDLISRCEFNRPYDFIRVRNLRCGDFLKSDSFSGNSIYWLDYDDSINDAIMEDIQILGTRLRNGSFMFLTVAADTPSDLRSLREHRRLELLKDQFGVFASELTEDDVDDVRFPMAVYKIIIAAVKNAFAARANGAFHPHFRVLYRDTVNMLTVGGYLCASGIGRTVRARLKRNLPFLLGDQDRPYRIRTFNLSERERHLIEFASTKRRGSKEANLLRRLGLRTAEIDAYRDLVRFMPRYFETML
jgi:hypothetical protein